MIDRETSEIVRVASYITVKQAEAVQKQTEGLNVKKAKEGGKSKAFTFTKMESVKAITNQFTNVELGYFLVLQSYMDYENLLIKSTHNKYPMSKSDMGKVLGIKNRGHLNKLLERFIQNGLLIEKVLRIDGGEIKGYFVNRDMHFKGTTRSRKVVKVFCNQIRILYKSHLTDKGSNQPADLGFIYKVLPYLHYETNILCFNPYEESTTNIKKMSMTDLCVVTGLDKKNLQNKIKRLNWDGMTVFLKVSEGRRMYFKVNPFLLYRKSGDADESTRIDFHLK